MAALGRSLWGALLVFQVNACVLIVEPIDHESGHCHVDGFSACATCLQTSCQTSIDACCNDSSCAGKDGHTAILDALDACGGGDKAACADRIGKDDSPLAAPIRTCVTGACKAACLGDAPVKVEWSCNAARTPDNACATCIYDSCGSALDECCGDSSCGRSTDLADDVSRCTAGDAPGCAYLVTKSDYGFEGKVRACITKQCAASCMDDRPHQSCSLQAGGSSCSCTDAAEARGPDCSVATLGGNCVRGEKGCTCGHYTCERDTSEQGCSCSFRGEGGSTTCNPVSHSGSSSGSSLEACCLIRSDSGFTCECKDYRSTCYTDLGQYPVPSCNLQDALDGLANVLVPTCSN